MGAVDQDDLSLESGAYVVPGALVRAQSDREGTEATMRDGKRAQMGERTLGAHALGDGAGARDPWLEPANGV